MSGDRGILLTTFKSCAGKLYGVIERDDGTFHVGAIDADKWRDAYVSIDATSTTTPRSLT